MIRPLTTATLNHLLAYELMAATACRSASLRYALLPVASILRQVMDGHQRRAAALHEAIRINEGHPAIDPATQDPAAVSPLPENSGVVLALLLDLEQRGVADYRQALRQIDETTRLLIEAELLPEQERALATVAGVQVPAADGTD